MMVNDITRVRIQMNKLEEKVNEILGVDTPTPEQKEFQPPVERKTGEVEVKIEKDINTDYDLSLIHI